MGNHILMAGPVLSGNRETAPLAENEVQHLPQTLTAQLGMDGKVRALLVSGPQAVTARFGKSREVHHLKITQIVADLLCGSGEHLRSGLRIQQGEGLGRAASNRRFPSFRPVACGGAQDHLIISLPAVLMLRRIHRFQDDFPVVIGQLAACRNIAAAQEYIEGQFCNSVPGHGGKFPDAVVPHAAVQIKNRGSFAKIGVRDGNGPFIFDRDIQVGDPRAAGPGAHLQANPVKGAPILRWELKAHRRGAEIRVVPVRGRVLRPVVAAQRRGDGKDTARLLKASLPRSIRYGDPLPGVEQYPPGGYPLTGKARLRRALPVQRKGAVQIQGLLQFLLKFLVHMIPRFK